MSDVPSIAQTVADFTAPRLDVPSRGWESGIAMLGLLALDQHLETVIEAVDTAIATRTDAGLLAFGWGDYPKEWMRWVEDDMSSYKPTVNTTILARSSMELYHRTNDDHYLDSLAPVYQYYETAPRTTEGAIIRRLDEREIFSETMYFLTPFFVEYGRAINDPSPIDDAIAQVKEHCKRLQDPHTGLYRHIWREVPNSYPLSNFWSRANGWAMAGILDTVLALPDDHPNRTAMTAVLVQSLEAVVGLQDESGFWHMVLDDPRSKLETSGTACLVYVLKRAFDKGIISDPAYRTAAKKGMDACARVITDEGAVRRVSKPPASANSPLDETLYGQGLFMLAASCFE